MRSRVSTCPPSWLRRPPCPCPEGTRAARGRRLSALGALAPGAAAQSRPPFAPAFIAVPFTQPTTRTNSPRPAPARQACHHDQPGAASNFTAAAKPSETTTYTMTATGVGTPSGRAPCAGPGTSRGISRPSSLRCWSTVRPVLPILLAPSRDLAAVPTPPGAPSPLTAPRCTAPGVRSRTASGAVSVPTGRVLGGSLLPSVQEVLDHQAAHDGHQAHDDKQRDRPGFTQPVPDGLLEQRSLPSSAGRQPRRWPVARQAPATVGPVGLPRDPVTGHQPVTDRAADPSCWARARLTAVGLSAPRLHQRGAAAPAADQPSWAARSIRSPARSDGLVNEAG